MPTTPASTQSAPTKTLVGSPFTPGERLLLDRFVERLRAVFPEDALQRILVFGSRAKHQGHEESDLDLAVFAAGALPADSHRRIAAIAGQVQEGWEDLPTLRPVLITDDEPTNPALLRAIDEDGVLLWTKTKR
jgi:predicted nucleotidyltransferase